MEELFERFPHLSENILLKLNHESLVICREVSRTWNTTVEVERASYLKIIKSYTQCSDELLKKIIGKCGSPIVLVSILKKIFGNFLKGTKQSHRYLKTWGNTPLHIAAGNGHMAAYHLIMDNVEDKNPMGKNLTAINSLAIPIKVQRPYCLRSSEDEQFEYTPLHLAAKNGYNYTCKLILENIVEKNPSNNRMFTPLHIAAANGNHSIFQMIIESIQDDKNPEDVFGNTPLHIAAAHGHFRICSLILSYNEVVKSLMAPHQETPYHLAAANGHIDVYKLLLEKKVHGKILTNRWGQYPLHHAAKYGHLDICKLILKNAQNKDNLAPNNCNCKDNLGDSPLELAIRNNHSEIQKYFMTQIGMKFQVLFDHISNAAEGAVRQAKREKQAKRS